MTSDIACIYQNSFVGKYFFNTIGMKNIYIYIVWYFFKNDTKFYVNLQTMFY